MGQKEQDYIEPHEQDMGQDMCEDNNQWRGNDWKMPTSKGQLTGELISLMKWEGSG